VGFLEDGSVMTFIQDGISQVDPADQDVRTFNPALGQLESSCEDPYGE